MVLESWSEFARPVVLIVFGSAAKGSVTPLRWIALLPNH